MKSMHRRAGAVIRAPGALDLELAALACSLRPLRSAEVLRQTDAATLRAEQWRRAPRQPHRSRNLIRQQKIDQSAQNLLLLDY